MVEEAIYEAIPRVAETMPAPGHETAQAGARGRDVAPCFVRFAKGELAGERVGRVGVAIFPALGEEYRAEVERADGARVAELEALIVRGLAIGYAFVDRALHAGGEEAFVTRQAEASWDAWTSRLNAGMLEQAGMDSRTMSALRATGAKAFREMGKDAGLKGRKLKRIGGYYAQAGGELRMVQSQPDLNIAASPWPFNRFPHE